MFEKTIMRFFERQTLDGTLSRQDYVSRLSFLSLSVVCVSILLYFSYRSYGQRQSVTPRQTLTITLTPTLNATQLQQTIEAVVNARFTQGAVQAATQTAAGDFAATVN